MGLAGQVRPNEALAPMGLSARPTESEHPETQINYHQEQRS
ncbi:hypothetical protein [Fictibacillus fluitans]|uniref:Uncharacterized protein n=1 Tax=Fictibacillus fluitans TaxID=3058422 RepID=A0ABT8I2J7_9BACL|nr:hypothetical protein [Fictibacillus sp. NE201]MDN4527253.1 hypothetical protein [Fictibacillus sp. NE201]